MRRIKSRIVQNSTVRYWIKRGREIKYRYLNDEQKKEAVKKYYKKCTGELLDFDCPKNFNQKIQWLKIYDSTEIKTTLSDKFLVRNWIKEKIGEEYLINLYGAFDSVEEIDFDKLPNRFAIKANHSSGMNIVIYDKNKMDWKSIKKQIKRWLKTPHDMSTMEQQYYSIRRKILVEEFIEQEDGDLIDYKIHCFHGEPKLIQIIGSRDLQSHTAKEACLDINWNRNQLMYDTYDTYAQYNEIPQKPKCFEEMLDIAKKLSSGFIYVRVDLYVVKTGIKFGEMTFTPASGIGNWGGERMG